MELLQDEAKDYPERLRELASIQYYLRDLLFEVTNQWLAQTDGVTNYAPLIGEILRLNKTKEPVSLVTFNYDLLLDHALESFGYHPQAPEDQFKAHETLKLFKPHGSVDWARTVRLPADVRINRRGLIEQADTIKLTNEFIRAGNPLSADSDPSGRTLFPVIAIPLQNKTEENFACPPSHLTHLKERLPNVTKILIIGWQAKEAHFLELLRAKLTNLTHLMVVGRDATDADSTLMYFLQQIGRTPSPLFRYTGRGGFTDFVVSREGEAFLRA